MRLEGSPVTVQELGSLALYNYGHFTSMYVDDLRVRGLDMHLSRLEDDSRTLFGETIDRERIIALVKAAVEGSQRAMMVRVTAYAPEFTMALPAQRITPRILVTCRPAPSPHAEPMKVQTIQYERDVPQVKHVGLFGPLYHRRSAQAAGFNDALFIDRSMNISEGVTWNIGFIEDGRVIWPDSEYLPGVTMRLVEQHCKSLGIESSIRPVNLAHIEKMTCAFSTNVTTGPRCIELIDSKQLSLESDILRKLQESYWNSPGDSL